MVRLGLSLGKSALANELQREPGNVPRATIAYMNRLGTEIESHLDFEPTGTRLALKLEGQQMTIAQTGVLVGLLLPAVQASREAARRMQSSNNMRQIMLANLNYHDMFRRFPNDLGTDPKNTTANLSWRVHILPFIEENALYQEFHLDEPWDSPHNIKLLNRMPPTYRDPRSMALPNHTTYQMPRGENMINNPAKATKMSFITDGTSNTVCLMLSTDQAAVPWTKPDDMDPLANPQNIAVHAGTVMVAMADGSVHNLRSPISAEFLKRLVIMNDGLPVTPDLR